MKRKKLKMFVCCTVVLTIVVGVCGGYVDASKKNDMPSETDSILNENDARVVKLIRLK